MKVSMDSARPIEGAKKASEQAQKIGRPETHLYHESRGEINAPFMPVNYLRPRFEFGLCKQLTFVRLSGRYLRNMACQISEVLGFKYR